MKKFYEIPFVTITEGAWTVQAESLEEAKAMADSGFPYEYSTYTDIKDENTSWDSTQVKEINS
jgi:hypothetical protein